MCGCFLAPQETICSTFPTPSKVLQEVLFKPFTPSNLNAGMKLSKKQFFRIHSWIGIKLSVLFFIVCFSGTLATLSSEMDWLLIPEIRATPQGTYASRNDILKNLQEAYPEAVIEYWATFEVPYLCHSIYMKEGNHRFYAFANPYTGDVQGAANVTFRRFFRDLHYFLFIPFQVGHFTVLIFGFLLLASLVTSLVFYKKWYRKFFELKTGKGSLVLFRSLHRLVGVWAIPFMLLFSVTGIWYFLERTNTAGISTLGNPKPPAIEAPFIDSLELKTLSMNLDYDRIVEVSRTAIPGLEVKDIAFPAKVDRPIYVTGVSHVPLVRNRANRIYLHPITYELVHVQRAEQSPIPLWLNDIADPLHFGYWGGLLTKVIWFFGGLAISGLVLTGIWISLKRKVKNEQKRKAHRMGAWKYVNWGLVGLMLVLMYGSLVARYQASATVIIAITIFWVVLAALGYYLFIYRIKQAVARELQAKT